MKTTDQYIEPAKALLKDLFISCGEGSIHGIEHAEKVLLNASEAISFLEPETLSLRNKNSILLAALLHDADDSKVFPGSKEQENAKKILNTIHYPYVEDVLEMIDLVSFRENGVNVVYAGVKLDYWKFIPRDADRIEALGTIGVARCIGYGSLCGRPLYDSNTPRLTTIESIHVYAINNNCSSSTTVEYFIRHLLPRSIMSSGLNYFTCRVPTLLEPIYKIIISYGKQGYLNLSTVLDIVQNDPGSKNILLQCAELS